MSVTSGFFNSLNGDRKYNSEQLSSLFDGIIRDGVFASIGDCFAVSENVGNTVSIKVGRAWFNHAWIYNDAILPLTADASEVILDRYDAVVIEINHTNTVRSGSIHFVKGTPASEPQYPTMTNADGVHQYPLAYIYRKAGSTSISQADIKNMVGTSSCPYITGILEVHNIDHIVAQWEAQWKDWSSQWEKWGSEWDKWFSDETNKVESEASKWMAESKANFDAWFRELQLILDGDIAAGLANRIIELENKFDTLMKDQSIVENLEDSNGNPIEDSYSGTLQGVMRFGVSGGGSSGSGGDSETVMTTLMAKGWIGEEVPYKYNLSLDGVTATSNQDILPPLDVTIEQLDALQGANIQDGGQTKGVITLFAFGTKPEIDLPIRVILRGGF